MNHRGDAELERLANTFGNFTNNIELYLGTTSLKRLCAEEPSRPGHLCY
jgi:hypothetical protein